MPLSVGGARRERFALRWRLIRRRIFHMGNEMAKKITRTRPWTKEEVRMLKSLTREKTRMVIARKLERSVDAMYGLASKLGVMLGGGRRRKETW
jgi:hypothetical protein